MKWLPVILFLICVVAVAIFLYNDAKRPLVNITAEKSTRCEETSKNHITCYVPDPWSMPESWTYVPRKEQKS